MKFEYQFMKVMFIIFILFFICIAAGYSQTPDPAPDTDDLTPTPTGQAPYQINGDVNTDKKIDIVDALLIAQYYVGFQLDNFNPGVANVNNDNYIDIVDALLVAQYYVGIIPWF